MLDFSTFKLSNFSFGKHFKFTNIVTNIVTNIYVYIILYVHKYKVTLSEQALVCSTVPPALPTKPPIPVPGIPSLAVVSKSLLYIAVQF